MSRTNKSKGYDLCQLPLWWPYRVYIVPRTKWAVSSFIYCPFAVFSWNILPAKLEHWDSNVSWDKGLIVLQMCLCSLIGLWVVDENCSDSLIFVLFLCETMLWLWRLHFILFPFFMSFALCSLSLSLWPEFLPKSVCSDEVLGLMDWWVCVMCVLWVYVLYVLPEQVTSGDIVNAFIFYQVRGRDGKWHLV